MMKKVISAIAVLLGLILAAIGIRWKLRDAASIVIIGGADGPTAIFVAGKVGNGMAIGSIGIGVVLIVVGIAIYRWIHKK